MADKGSERKASGPEGGMRAATKLSGDRMVTGSNKQPRTIVEIDNTREKDNVTVKKRDRPGQKDSE